jgi:hypothetical protein
VRQGGRRRREFVETIETDRKGIPV